MHEEFSKLNNKNKSNPFKTGKKYNKASGGDEIPPELFKILKDDAVKVLHSIME